MQGCVKKINLKTKTDAYWNNFVVKDVSLKVHIGRVVDASRWYSQGWFTMYNIKVLVLHTYIKLSINVCVSWALTVVTVWVSKLTDWLVFKNDCADLIDPSAVGSTQ